MFPTWVSRIILFFLGIIAQYLLSIASQQIIFKVMSIRNKQEKNKSQ